jgi:hypothetical protein
METEAQGSTTKLQNVEETLKEIMGILSGYRGLSDHLMTTFMERGSSSRPTVNKEDGEHHCFHQNA